MKISGIVAAAVFVLSCLIGLVVGASIFRLLLRAVILALLYFAAMEAIRRVAKHFLGDLWSEHRTVETSPQVAVDEPGSQVDVSVGDDEDAEGLSVATVDEAAFLDSFDEADDQVANWPQKGLDQGAEDSYTEAGLRTVDFGGQSTGGFAARPPDQIGEIDSLPDLDGFSDSFAASYSSVGNSDNEPEHLGTDLAGTLDKSERFAPGEMALAIRTLLKKDQKG